MQASSAVLALADGTIFKGRSIGAQGSAVGEVVFNTAMTGYQEILSDPSYCQQIVTLTYPHIGNVGVNADDEESTHIHAAGLVVRDVPRRHQNWRAQRSLGEYLESAGTVAIADIDTRMLTRLLRSSGAQAGCVYAYPDGESEQSIESALIAARAFAGLAGMDLAQQVSTAASYGWSEGAWALERAQEDNAHLHHDPADARWHVVAYDFGVKKNILRMLADRDCRLTVVPAKTSAAEVLALAPDGVFLSNGPGDPEPCEYAIEAISEFLTQGLPIFGICLGHQLLALAGGARTMKMKFGHHGANHPVKALVSGQVLITSQNHGFAVDEASLPNQLEATHRSLFDGSLQGIRFKNRPAFGFQGHPEASPGPHDVSPLFDQFIDLMTASATDGQR